MRDWDATGVQIIGQMHRTLGLQGCQLCSRTLPGRKRVEQALRAYGLYETLPAEHLFPDTDRALEYAEDLLLANSASDDEALAWHHTQLNNTLLLAGLSQADQGVLSNYFETLSIKAKEALFRMGDSAINSLSCSKGKYLWACRLMDKQPSVAWQPSPPAWFLAKWPCSMRNPVPPMQSPTNPRCSKRFREAILKNCGGTTQPVRQNDAKHRARNVTQTARYQPAITGAGGLETEKIVLARFDPAWSAD